MDLPDLKQLDNLIALCRKRGVKSFCIGEMKFELSDVLLNKVRRHSKAAEPSTSGAAYEQELTPEELLFWSSEKNIYEDNKEN